VNLVLDKAVFRFTVILMTCLLAAFPVKAQDTLSTDSVGRYPQLRSVLVQGEIMPFIAGFGGLVDLDFVRLPSGHLSTLGIRFSVDRYTYGGPGGESSDSPALDYNVLLRHTASGRVFRFDIYFGYCHYSKRGVDGLKFGLDFQFAIIEHFWSLLAKLSLPAGAGFSAGWQR
jgi:hypothetical protein